MPEGIYLDEQQISDLDDLYQKGLYLQAYEQTKALGSIKDWRGERGRILAGRLAYNLGAHRLGYLLHYRAWKEHPESGEVIYFYARALLYTQGPYRTLRFIRETGELPENTSKERKAEWVALEGYLLGRYRDFDNADKCIEQARKLDPDSDWIELERASLYEFQDRYEDALEVTTAILEKSPWYRSGVQHHAQLLQSMGRDEEALELMKEALTHIESSGVAAQCLQLQIELQQYPEALESLEIYEKLTPLKDKNDHMWVAGRRSDIAYYLGDIELAISSAQEEGNQFYKHLAEKLKESKSQKSVRLDVEYVRQHHMTCGPATLTSIAQYWGREVDHLDVVEDIWYDGTSEYNERKWALDNGYVAHEFTLTWDSAVALLDKGIPFTLSTVEPGSAHLQAVIGYDEARGVFLVRDPGTRATTEFFAEKSLEYYAWTGPRAMALVPEEKADLLEDINLPDKDLYDRYFWIKGALEKNDRDAASAHIEEMEQRWPEHRLLHVANRSIAIYDDSEVNILNNTEKLLAQYPGNINFLMSKQQSLGNLGRRKEQQEFIEKACVEYDEHSSLLMQRAQLLSDDAREFETVEEILQKLIRWQPQNAQALFLLAYLRWEQKRYEESIELYRLTSCLEDKIENYVSNYFKALRCRKRGEEGIEFLKDRYERFGDKSAFPAISLCRAYEWVELDKEAHDALEAAVNLRPDDPDLLLFGSDFLARHSEFEKAHSYLERAKGKCQELRWLIEHADLADYEGELSRSMEYWQQVLAIDPMHYRAIRMMTRLLSEMQDRQTAIDFLEGKKDDFPHHRDLQELWGEWLDEAPLEEKVTALRRLIEMNEMDDWAQRELGRILGYMGRYEEALEALEVARKLDPTHASYYNLVGELNENQGNISTAIEAYREALKLSIDNDYAMRALLGCCRTLESKKEQLEFIRQELISQVTLGDGLMSFQTLAGQILEPQELISELKNAVEQRPDLWSAWAAISREYVDAGELEEALKYSLDGTERFPLLPRLWLDQAYIHQLMNESEKEKACLERALEISPSWSAAVRKLAEFHEIRGDFEQSKQLMEGALVKTPLDPYCRGFLADALWHLGERELALVEITRAIELDPEYDWAWGALENWSAYLGQYDLPEQTVRTMLETKAGDKNLWCILARMQSDPEEKLQSLDKAIELSPRLIQAHEPRIVLMTREGEFDAARSAVNHPCWDGSPPVRILGHLPWISREQGQVDRAINEMIELIEKEPGYYDGLRMLADWCDNEERYEEYYTYSQAMLNLEPNSSHAFSYVGDALHSLQRDDEAIPYLQQASARDPSSTLSNFVLFDIYKKQEDISAMQALMERMRMHIQDNDYVVARDGALAAMTGDKDYAFSCIESLAMGNSENRWLFNTCIESIKKAGWTSDLINLFGGLLDKEGCLPCAAAIWGELISDESAWKPHLNRLQEIYKSDSEIGMEAMTEYQYFLAHNGTVKEHRRLIKRVGVQLKESSRTWGAAVKVFGSKGDSAKGIKWAGDWKKHSEGDGNALFYYSQLHWAKNNIDLALEVNHLGFEDEEYNFHTPWLAIGYFIKNDLEKSRLYWDRIDHENMNSYHKMILEILQLGYKAADETVSNREAIEAMKKRALITVDYEPGVRDEVFEIVLEEVFKRIVKARKGLAWKIRTRLIGSYA